MARFIITIGTALIAMASLTFLVVRGDDHTIDNVNASNSSNVSNNNIVNTVDNINNIDHTISNVNIVTSNENNSNASFDVVTNDSERMVFSLFLSIVTLCTSTRV